MARFTTSVSTLALGAMLVLVPMPGPSQTTEEDAAAQDPGFLEADHQNWRLAETAGTCALSDWKAR